MPIRWTAWAGEAFTKFVYSGCTCHTHVIPAESYGALNSPDDRLREISLLQQKARSLENEIVQRRRVERELQDFVDNALEGLHKVGPDGIILWANKAELDLLGYQPDEYIGHHIARFHDDPEVIEKILAKLLRGESLYNCPVRLRCKDGSIKHVLLHSNAYFENGKFLYSRCFSRDVTHLKDAEIAQQRLAAIVDSSRGCDHRQDAGRYYHLLEQRGRAYLRLHGSGGHRQAQNDCLPN